MTNACVISKRAQKLAESPMNLVRDDLLDQGIVNLGTSENKIMYDVLKPKFQEAGSHDIQEYHTQYCDFKGTHEFRKSIGEFLDYYMKPVESIDPDNLVVLNGCNAIVEAMATCLADPGEGFLLPTPFYGGFNIDLKQRAQVVPFPVYLSNKPAPGETGPFQLSVYRLEQAMEEAKKQNIKIRAILLCNPNNPFGYIYSEKLLQDYLEFAQRHSLHVVIDEIYFLSIFKKEHSMKSMLALNNLPDKQYVHVIWGFSKDFGVSGFRCGVLHTWNKEVLSALRWIAYFQSVPTSTQCLLRNLIIDRDWIDNVYIPTNHKRLLECYHIVCDGLNRAGIPYMESYAGLFIWADFRELVPSLTLEEEQKVFEKFLDFKVYIGPGQSFCYNQAGWFRLVFATHPDQLKIGMDRVVACVNNIRKDLNSNRNENDCHDKHTTCNDSTTDGAIGGGESLEELAQALRSNIRNSNWLSLNTAEKWTKENPELAEAFLKNIPKKD